MAVVMIESPYSGDIDRNIRYLALCGFDAGVLRDECPYASHGLMTQHPRATAVFISDYDAKWDGLTREQSIEMSQRMRSRCDLTVFYTDLGWSSGMHAAKAYCVKHQLPYVERVLSVSELAKRIPFCTADFCNALIEGRQYQSYLE